MVKKKITILLVSYSCLSQLFSAETVLFFSPAGAVVLLLYSRSTVTANINQLSLVFLHVQQGD